MNTYVFILGRETEIARAEIEAVLLLHGFEYSLINVTDNVLAIKCSSTAMDDGLNGQQTTDQKIGQLASVLGGTIKIYRIVAEYSGEPLMTLKKLLREKTLESAGKFIFGLSSYTARFGKERVNKLGLQLKKEIAKEHSVRFVALQEEKELSSIQSLKNGLDSKGLEIGIFNNAIGELIGLSNPEEWSKRDYGKPAGDKYSGMVPPKLARMLINITLGLRARIINDQLSISNHFKNSQINQLNENCKIAPRRGPFGKNCKFHDCVVVEPFCGSGNILMEALMLGCDVVGSDVSAKAVEDTKTNLKWLKANSSSLIADQKKQLAISNKPLAIFQADATSSQLIENWKLKIGNYNHVVVVTEPYLGKPKKFKSSYGAIRAEYKIVRELYIKFLKNLILGTRYLELCTICVVFPLVETFDQGQFSLYRDSVDEIRDLGYTEVRPPLIYGRDYQVVKRQIVFLKHQSPRNNNQK
ncbi:MAG TPA: hypothetical protein PK263_05115 [bacterium]|nr:hypothetical protein [bacterium]